MSARGRPAAVPAGQRLHALDAARGLLALVVVARHVALALRLDALGVAADIAVAVFFAMSGYVLARAGAGPYLGFLLRRAVRLWPVYAVCLAAACLSQSGALPPVRELLWWPATLDTSRMADPPAWSLFVEAWVTPLLPLMFLVTRRGQFAAVAMVVAAALLMQAAPWSFPLLFFALGVALTAFPIDWPQRVPAPLRWLGKISYSLYLSHDVLLLALPLAVALPLILPVAWALWWAVERPSILWSRMVAPVPPPVRAKA